MDPNLPQDMQQQQQQQPAPRRKKQLPSLGGSLPPSGGVDDGAGDGHPRRLKKLPPTAGAPPTLEEPVGPSAPAAAAAAAPRPRKKKRQQPAANGGGLESSPDHGTAPISAQQQLLPAADAGADDGPLAASAPDGGRPRRKKRRQPAAAAAADEDARRSPDGREADGAPAPAATVARTLYIDVEGMPLAKALETVREDVVTRGGEGAAGRVNFGADLTDGGDEDGQQKRRPKGPGDDEENGGGGGGGGGGGRQAGESNMSDTIFWQTQDARTFKSEKLDKYQQRLEQERKEREQYLEGIIEEDSSNRTLKCAIGFTKVYNYIGTVLLGLMPGFAILHTGYVWSLSANYLSFLAAYTSLAGPMPILYYVVLTLLVLSVLDRYDTGKLDRQSCLDCASFRHAGMVVLLYAPAYVVSNAMYPTDQWIRRYTYNASAYAGQVNGDSLVQSWRIMDAVRAVCLVLGWLVVAFNPQFNRLSANLETELDDLIGEDQPLEMGVTANAGAGGTTRGLTAGNATRGGTINAAATGGVGGKTVTIKA